MEIILIAAADLNNGIGYKGKLPWHLPNDLKRFKKLTTDHPVIMGRKTYETLPVALKNRGHIILTNQKDYNVEDAKVVSKLGKAFEICYDNNEEKVYVIGGGEIYKQSIEYASKIELTRVQSRFKCDTFFPEIPLNEFKCIKVSPKFRDSKHDYDYDFITYEREVITQEESFTKAKLTFLDDLRLWWKFDGVFTFSRIRQGIKNLKKWTPTIWKDRNYDHTYLLDLIEFKLRDKAKYFKNQDRFEGSQRNSEVLKLCAELTNKIRSEYYSSEYFDYYNSITWFEPTEKEGFSEFKDLIVFENFEEYFKKYPRIYKRVLEGEGPLNLDGTNDNMRIAMNIGFINHKRAKRLLFKTLEEKLEYWWD